MREESQLDEMRAAIRGDFERLAERRGEQELMRVAIDDPASRPVDEMTQADVQLPVSWHTRLGRWLVQPEASRRS
jgi:hypothetical protein